MYNKPIYTIIPFRFSLLPAIVLYPQFVAAGTKLYATGYPGENATLTCEALGGLSIPGGLQLSLLRGVGLKDLAEQAISQTQGGHATDVQSATPSTSTLTYQEEGGPIKPGHLDRIEVIRPGIDPRYHLTAGPDPKNPYAAMIKLTITSRSCSWLKSMLFLCQLIVDVFCVSADYGASIVSIVISWL